jgi:thymidine phosphorylase
MEVLAPVDLSLDEMRRVVDETGGCVAWGGRVRLSPADDRLIQVERPLDFDSEGQLVASVVSKKIAAGSTHVIIDIPVGPTAKVRSSASANALRARLEAVAGILGIHVRVHLSDGSQPVGRGIGPALEARDVLAVLQGQADAPMDLRERSLSLATEVIQFARGGRSEEARRTAEGLLSSGAAWRKFAEICRAQGGLREPPRAALTHVMTAGRGGICVGIDNRRVARVAKLAGAPDTPAAGLDLHVRVGDRVERGQPLFTIHAGAPGELNYSLDYARQQLGIVAVEEP